MAAKAKRGKGPASVAAKPSKAAPKPLHSPEPWEFHDYKRMVACVNACEGIPTETLERIALDSKRSIEEHVRDIEAAADEMLDMTGPIPGVVRAAIAKARPS